MSNIIQIIRPKKKKHNFHRQIWRTPCLLAADWLSSPDSIPVPSWVELRALEDADLIRELVRGNHDASRSRSISQAYIQHRSPHPEERN